MLVFLLIFLRAEPCGVDNKLTCTVNGDTLKVTGSGTLDVLSAYSLIRIRPDEGGKIIITGVTNKAGLELYNNILIKSSAIKSNLSYITLTDCNLELEENWNNGIMIDEFRIKRSTITGKGSFSNMILDYVAFYLPGNYDLALFSKAEINAIEFCFWVR